MSKDLGILVSSDRNLEHLIGICQAARRAGKEVTIFLSARGVLLSKDPRFQEMEACPDISLCNVGFEHFEMTKPVYVVQEKNFATQMRHAIMIEDCQRYIVL
ncbi:MAG: hypothetical protein KQJ78_23005 [Deltaproteobacteria bacterium]|nr:hypothetical protein [Deltaproteobacteria bacterium]